MRLVVAVLIVLTSIVLTSTAVAQPGATPPYHPAGPQPIYAPPPPVYAPQQPVDDAPPLYAPARMRTEQPPPKNESTATWLSVGATAAGLGTMFLAASNESEGLVLAGVGLTLIGPSAGHLYAGESAHAVKFSLVRGAGLLTFIYGALMTSAGHDACFDGCSGGDGGGGQALMWIGGAVVVGATLYDFYDAPRAARRTNRKQELAWSVAPTMMSANGQHAPGLALGGSF